MPAEYPGYVPEALRPSDPERIRGDGEDNHNNDDHAGMSKKQTDSLFSLGLSLGAEMFGAAVGVAVVSATKMKATVAKAVGAVGGLVTAVGAAIGVAAFETNKALKDGKVTKEEAQGLVSTIVNASGNIAVGVGVGTAIALASPAYVPAATVAGVGLISAAAAGFAYQGLDRLTGFSKGIGKAIVEKYPSITTKIEEMGQWMNTQAGSGPRPGPGPLSYKTNSLQSIGADHFIAVDLDNDGLKYNELADGGHTLEKDDGIILANVKIVKTYQELKDLNNDGDSEINGNDRRTFNDRIRIWKDTNQNGLIDDNEHFTLRQLGVRAVGAGDRVVVQNINEIRGKSFVVNQSKFNMGNGNFRTWQEVDFSKSNIAPKPAPKPSPNPGGNVVATTSGNDDISFTGNFGGVRDSHRNRK